MQSDSKTAASKIVLISAATTFSVLLFVAAIVGSAYYFALSEATPLSGEKSEPLSDKLKRAERTLGLSSTDASEITAISFSSWAHAGPLHPGPNDPSGYVIGSSVTFGSDLTATLSKGKNYDRAGDPDEISNSTGQLTEQQFRRLAEICAKFDLANESNATGNISEAAAQLTIEYKGELKKIVTSNTGNDSPGVTELRKAMDELQRTVAWTPAGKR